MKWSTKVKWFSPSKVPNPKIDIIEWTHYYVNSKGDRINCIILDERAIHKKDITILNTNNCKVYLMDADIKLLKRI